MTRKSCLCLALLAWAGLAVVGCSLFSANQEGTHTPPTATVRPTAIGTPPETSSADAVSPTSTPTSEAPLNLVLWTSEDFAPTSETEGGRRLLEQIRAFQQSYGVGVDVILKKRTGTGGLLDFLTTASMAAPSILPDLITLNESDLYRAAQAGLLQPLDGLVSPAVLSDQFGFAQGLTRLGEATVGLLYQADLSHLVYDATAMDIPPLAWQDIYSSTVPFVFSPSAPSDQVNDVILLQYLARGGRLTDGQGGVNLEVEPLSQALEPFHVARQLGIIPQSVLDLSDATTAWATFRIGEAGIVQVSASLYLAERASLSSAGFAAVPPSRSDVVTIGHGWALAMVTQDPGRQESAAAFIEHLLAPENNGTWAMAANRLPAGSAALGFWDQDDAYVPFIRDLLTRASPAPNPDLAAKVGSPLVQALTDVLSGRATPAEAAQAAAAAVPTGE